MTSTLLLQTPAVEKEGAALTNLQQYSSASSDSESDTEQTAPGLSVILLVCVFVLLFVCTSESGVFIRPVYLFVY